MRGRRPSGPRSVGRQRSSSHECPGWNLHWSQPEQTGKTPSFCSVCGSRSQSRRRLNGASVSLRHQLEVLREIARQQKQNIDVKVAESEWLNDCLRQKRISLSSLQSPAAKSGVDALISEVKVEVERMHCELGVWRGASFGSATSPHVDEGVRQEEARHELERQRWQNEKNRLHKQLLDAKERTAQVQTLNRAPSSAEVIEITSARAEVGYLRDEVAAERAAVSLARERLTASRLEADNEKRSQERLTTQDEQTLATTLQEISLTERRIEVEAELQRAQQAQLRSVQSTVGTLRAQLERTRQEAQELRASLVQNQEMLRRLTQ